MMQKIIIKNWIQIFLFVLILLFDLIVTFSVNSYYNHPFIFRDYVRASGYTMSLIRDGFVLVNGDWYYCDKNARLAKDEIVDIDGDRFYFDKDGKLITNKKDYKIKDRVYEIDQNGIIAEMK